MKRRLNSLKQCVGDLIHSKTALAGLIIVIIVLLLSLLAPLLTPFDQAAIEIRNRLKAPFWMEGGDARHLLGTDSMGHDVFTRLLYGGRLSLVVAFSSVFFSTILGVVLGLISGYCGGWVDKIIMRITEIQMAFPFILLAISILAVLGPGVLNTIIVLAVTGWVDYARVVRAQTLAVKRQEYVEAAVSIGLPTRRILFHHILPNVMAPVLVIFCTSISQNIIMEASLSFLGLGVPPETASWGSMLSGGREFITSAGWLTVVPGLAIVITIIGISMLGDWLRDYFDPKVKK